MIKPHLCLDCKKPLKDRKAVRCRGCSTRQRFVKQGIDWKPEELATLTAYAGKCEQIKELKSQLLEAKCSALSLRYSLLKRHPSSAITRKVGYMKSKGQLKAEVTA